MSELESPGSYRVWGWQHQLEDTYKFQQVRKVRIPFLAVSVHFCAFFFFIYPPLFFFCNLDFLSQGWLPLLLKSLERFPLNFRGNWSSY